MSVRSAGVKGPSPPMSDSVNPACLMSVGPSTSKCPRQPERQRVPASRAPDSNIGPSPVVREPDPPWGPSGGVSSVFHQSQRGSLNCSADVASQQVGCIARKRVEEAPPSAAVGNVVLDEPVPVVFRMLLIVAKQWEMRMPRNKLVAHSGVAPGGELSGVKLHACGANAAERDGCREPYRTAP